MGDGDGWVECAAGHRHWGRHGAAGLLLTGPGRVVLQHRSIRTHEGGTWALPGGARDSHEDPVQTALREAGEEAGISASGVQPLGLVRADHQGWSYTTVIGRAVGDVRPFAANWESDDVRWWDLDAVAALQLHPGFAAAWPHLRLPAPPLHIVVDSANVVGSRPDGWWRDRAAATARLRDGLLLLARAGIAPARMPAGLTPTGLTAVLPHITMVVEGAARAAANAPGAVPGAASGAASGAVRGAASGAVPGAVPGAASGNSSWWSRSVTSLPAPGSGDDAVVARANALGAPVLVVTADRGLRARLSPHARVAGPAWLLEQLDSLGPAAAR